MDNFERDFWKYFKEISDIPRKSGAEKNMSNYLIGFAKSRALKYYVDDLYNVIIWKNASEGYEYSEILGLQCHLDMICEKKSDSMHDFSTDPIELMVDGDFVKANKTTLGADNGIGIAYILAILDSKKIKSPKLECIFTVQEETTMNGVIQLDSGVLQSRRIISFDNFSEDEMWIGSATAKEWFSEINTEKIELPANGYSTYLLNLSHFKGGHSGLNIGDASRGNPIKEVSKLLKDFSDIYISEFEGGTAVNVIPRNCKVIFSISNTEIVKIKKVEKEINKLEKLFPTSDIFLEKIVPVSSSYNRKVSKNILDFIYTFKNGELEKDKYGNIILSGNFAAAKSDNNTISFMYSVRDNSINLGTQLENDIRLSMSKYGIVEKQFNNITGYESNEESKLIKFCEKEYFNFFNKPIRKVKVQACLECGYFAEKIPNLSFIAIAPNIYDAHSPNERISIKSANRMWNFIIKLLENMK